MGNDVKVLIGELNGQELDQQEEYNLQFDDLPTIDVSTTPPNVGDSLKWDGTNWVPAVASANGAGVGGVRITFFHDGATSNQWLQQDNHHTEMSGPQSDDKSEPFIFPFNGQLGVLTYISKDEDTDIDIEFYKNGTLDTTWEIRNRKWESKTDLTPITFSAGDQLSVFAKKFSGGTGDDSPDTVLIHAYISFTASTEQELGGSTL